MRYRNVQLGFCVAFEDLRVDYVGSEVEDRRGLVVDVLVARFCVGSDAPLHVLSVELELSFGELVAVWHWKGKLGGKLTLKDCHS